MRILLFCSFLSISIALFSQEVVDGIAAQVGDNVILFSDIQGQKLQAMQQGMEANKELECQILEEMMYQELLLNQAKLDSVQISDAQVDAEMENRIRVIENQIGSREKMEEFYGLTIREIKNKFREAIRDRLLAQEMERQITAEVSVTPREAKEFYNSLPADSVPFINAQMKFQQIVYYPEITADDKDRARKELEDIRQQAIDGTSFSTLARLHSEDPGSAQKGGEMEATRGMMVAPFEATVFSLEKNEISNVFETQYGFHIVKLLERKGDNYTCAHILIPPAYSDEALEKAAYKLDSCYRRLEANEITWNQAVQRYSNDEATKQNKGVITNPISGEQTWDMEDLSQVDQQIFRITDNMEVGDLSEPSLYINQQERKEGVRIVRLADRTPPHKANMKQDYSLIQRAAESQKKEKIKSKWTEEKIKNAYIRVDKSFLNCDFKNEWVVNQ